jgi:uncharacterized integral membrane protein
VTAASGASGSPGGPGDGLDVDAARQKAAHARRVGARMMALGWFVLVVGVLSMLAVVALNADRLELALPPT